MMLSLSSCGYHISGLKAEKLDSVDSFSVRMFENNTLEPLAAVLVTNAIADALQRDGALKMVSDSAAQCRVEGKVAEIKFSSLRPDPYDTYISTEIQVELMVTYRIIDNKTNNVLMEYRINSTASYFNQQGDVQSARENAISYVARKIGDEVAIQTGTR